MSINGEFIVYGLIFVAVLLLVEGIYLTVFGKSISLNSKVNRRMDMLGKGVGREQVLDQLRKEMAQHMNSSSIPLYSILARKAQKANIAFSPSQLMILMVVLGVVSFIGLSVGTTTSLPVRAGISVLMGIISVFMWINGKAKKRIALLEEQLPDAIELMVRSLRVGHPFTSTLAIVATEIPDPLGTEMGVIADECTYGRDIGEALKDMAERIGIQDLRFLAVAVTIQQTSGGNLAEILHGLSKVIRARFKLFRQVKAITAEAQWSGTFLSGFPLLALIAINISKPDYYDEVMETEYFIPACLVVAAFLIVNVFVMKILVNIKV